MKLNVSPGPMVWASGRVRHGKGAAGALKPVTEIELPEVFVKTTGGSVTADPLIG